MCVCVRACMCVHAGMCIWSIVYISIGILICWRWEGLGGQLVRNALCLSKSYHHTVASLCLHETGVCIH